MRSFLLFTLLIISISQTAKAQKVAVKTNALYWLTTTINGGVEFSINSRNTIDLSGAYNPWTFKDGKKLHLWMAQPEFRHWFCEKFEGHFIGIHAHGGQFFAALKDKRYDGNFVGGGFSYGFDWILSPHWNLEATLGLGYTYSWYRQSPWLPCIKCQKDKEKHYVGPTKLGITFTYIF